MTAVPTPAVLRSIAACRHSTPLRCRDFCLRHSTYPRPQNLRPSGSESVSVAVELSKLACDILELSRLILRLRLRILASFRVGCVVSTFLIIPPSQSEARPIYFTARRSNGLQQIYHSDRKISASAFPITEAVKVRLSIRARLRQLSASRLCTDL